MDQSGRHLLGQCRIDQPLPSHGSQPLEGRGDDANPVVAAPAASARVAGMKMAVVDDLDVERGELLAQALPDTLRRVHARSLWQAPGMSKPATPPLPTPQCERVALLFAAFGIESEIRPAGAGLGIVDVDDADEARARRLLAEGLPEAPRQTDPADRIDAPRFWFGRGSTAVVGIVVLCSKVFWRLSPDLEPLPPSAMIDAGASVAHLLYRQEYWRLASAVFLHFDLSHLAGNMTTLLIVGPPLAHLLGPLRFLLLFVLAGIGGNVISFALGTAAVKVGASGAIAGVLGGLGGQALRAPGGRRRRHLLRTLGAVAAAYSMLVGFRPGADHLAHAGGLASGLLLGWWLARPNAAAEVTR